MGYIGAVGPAYDPTRATVPQFDAERFSGDGSTVAFTILRKVVSPTDVEVFVDNVQQEPIVAYSIVNGSTLTFTGAPSSGTNNIYVVYRGSGVSNFAFVPDGSISTAKFAQNIRQFGVDNFTANGTGQTFTLSETPASANTVIAAIDGVIQTAPSNYSISGTTIIFTSAPSASANVTVRHLGFRTTTTVTALSAGAVGATELAAGSVTNAKLAGSITSDKLVSVNGSLLIANTVANSAIQTGAVENYLRGANLDFGMRNRFINGAMRIDQRNAGVVLTPTDGTYSLDRFRHGVSQSAKFTVQQDSSANTTAGFASSLKVTSLSAYSITSSDFFTTEQYIEGNNISDLAWGTASAKTITLSFYVRSSLTGTFGGSLSNSASNRSQPFTYTIVTANTWEQKVVTIAGDTSGTWLTTNGIGIRVYFGLGVGSTYSGATGSWAAADYRSATGATSVVGTNGATLLLTGLQLEASTTPTGFEYRQIGTELQLCQRYTNVIKPNIAANGLFSGMWFTSTGTLHTYSFPVQMRAAPTLTVSAVGDFQTVSSAGVDAASVVALSGAGVAGCRMDITSSVVRTAGQGCIVQTANTSSTLTYSAEL